MSRVLPILFNTEMVQAILDGRKTVTRRVVKLPKYIQEQENGLYTLFAEGTCYENQHFEQIIDYLKKPYQPGDILYVRERFCRGKIVYGEEPDGRAVPYVSQCDVDDDFIPYEYCLRKNIGIEDVIWTPSIHMPKEAARIWLKVTDVRVERLQDITEEGAIKEGLYKGWQIPDLPKSSPAMTARQAFMWVWNPTIKKSDFARYGWAANPWVWVIEFERCEKPESEG